jgi:HEAT repeat protein
MRTRILAAGLLLGIGLAGANVGCSGDPNDANTWVKKLGNLRDQQEALNRLANMDVEKARVAVPALMALYKESKHPEHLEALARYRDERSKPVLIEALDYSDDDFDKAVIAAGVLGEMKAVDAVDPLLKAAEKPLPIKSRANSAKLAAMRALVKIGDKRAVPVLAKILTTSADEQDFLLNQKAALGLAEMRDPSAVPALIKGLFMTGRGTETFQECRLALVRVGDAAIDPLIALLENKNVEIRTMAKEREFDKHTPGIVSYKAAVVLGDLRAKKAVGPLLTRLKTPQKGAEHSAVLDALGRIGTPEAVDTLIAIAKDGKASPPLRGAAINSVYLSGDRRAVPTLMELAKTAYVKTPDGEKASDLRAAAAIQLARIAGKEHYPRRSRRWPRARPRHRAYSARRWIACRWRTSAATT